MFGKPAPNLDLSVIKGVNTNCFLELLPVETPSVGSIECDVYLEPGSLLNVVFNADFSSGKYYMARLDTRGGSNKDNDAILKKPDKSSSWQFVERSKEVSSAREWHRMKIKFNRGSVELFKDQKQIVRVDSVEEYGKKIGIFNEVGEVHVDNFSVISVG